MKDRDSHYRLPRLSESCFPQPAIPAAVRRARIDRGCVESDETRPIQFVEGNPGHFRELSEQLVIEPGEIEAPTAATLRITDMSGLLGRRIDGVLSSAPGGGAGTPAASCPTSLLRGGM